MLQEWKRYLTEQVNKGIYVMGAQGQIATPAFISKYSQRPKDALALYQKRLNAGIPASEILADRAFLEAQNLVHIHAHKHKDMIHTHPHEHPAHDHPHLQ